MKNVLNEIASWKIDATHKANERYFFKNKVVEEIVSGDAPLIIGRKGTGKTAIALHLIANPRHDKFSAYFDFRELRAATINLGAQTGPAGINPWITIWKAILGQQVITLMAQNESLGGSGKTDIQRYLSNSPLDRGTIAQLQPTKVSTNIKIPYFEITRTKEGDGFVDGRLWAPIARQGQEIMRKYGRGAAYYVVVDCIGDDVQTVSEEYTQIVIGIIKAAIHLRNFSIENNIDVFPCVFLRDDIYGELIDPDASKWNDYAAHLSWGEHSLKEMLNYRIEKAIDPSLEVAKKKFETNWSKIATVLRMYNNDGSKINVFNWIWRHTHSRPRDFVRYMRIAAMYAIAAGSKKITTNNLKRSTKKYSEEFRDELIHEMSSQMTIAKGVMEMLQQINLNEMSFSTFAEAYSQKFSKRGNVPLALDVLKTLYKYNVIGYVGRSVSNYGIFNYTHAGSEYIEGRPIRLHRSLCKGLMIY